MTALRQFNGKRKAFVLKYLLETKLIFDKNFGEDSYTTALLDLKWSNFDEMDLREDGIMSKINFTSLLCANSTERIAFRKIRLSYGILDNILIKYVDFQEAILENTSFQNTHMIQVSFIKAKFDGSTVKECDFTEAELTGSTLTNQQLHEALLHETIMPDGKTIGFQNLMRIFFIHSIYNNWTEEMDINKHWHIHYESNNDPKSFIKSSLNNDQWRYDIYAKSNIMLTHQIEIP